MELNNINFWANKAVAFNKHAEKEEAKPEEKQAEIRDNKPAEKQVAGEDVLTFMATRSVDIKVNAKKVENPKQTEDRIGGFMADFEAAYDELAGLGLSEEAIFEIIDKM